MLQVKGTVSPRLLIALKPVLQCTLAYSRAPLPTYRVSKCHAHCRARCGISALRIFFFNFSKNISGKKCEKNVVHLFFFSFFNFISEKKVKIYFFQYFSRNVVLKMYIFFKKYCHSSAMRVLSRCTNSYNHRSRGWSLDPDPAGN